MPKDNQDKDTNKNIFFRINLFLANKERLYFIEQLSMLINSGIDVLTAVETIKKEISRPALKQVIDEISKDLQNGEPLWQAIDAADIFPDYATYLVRSGEQTGSLSENLKLVAEQTQRDKEFNVKLISALIYPSIVLALTFLIAIGTSTFILPQISNTFVRLGVETNFITEAMITLGEIFSNYGILATLGSVGIVFLFVYILFLNPKTKVIGQAIAMRFPGFSRLIKEIELSRFGYTLGILLDRGIPIIESFEYISEVTSFQAYRKLYKSLGEDLERGLSLSESLEQYGDAKRLIPISVQQLLFSAEQSGGLPDALLNIGEIYRRKIEQTSKNLSTVLEPILLIFVWAIVLVVAIGIIIPIYSLVGSIDAY